MNRQKVLPSGEKNKNSSRSIVGLELGSLVDVASSQGLGDVLSRVVTASSLLLLLLLLLRVHRELSAVLGLHSPLAGAVIRSAASNRG